MLAKFRSITPKKILKLKKHFAIPTSRRLQMNILTSHLPQQNWTNQEINLLAYILLLSRCCRAWCKDIATPVIHWLTPPGRQTEGYQHCLGPCGWCVWEPVFRGISWQLVWVPLAWSRSRWTCPVFWRLVWWWRIRKRMGLLPDRLKCTMHLQFRHTVTSQQASLIIISLWRFTLCVSSPASSHRGMRVSGVRLFCP